MPWLRSSVVATMPGRGLKKLGQPVPEVKAASDENRVWPQPEHW